MSSSETWRRWGLVLPAVTIIILFSILPLGVVIVYSLLTPGDYGNVKWIFSTDGWFSVLFERDIFDDTVSLSDANLTILGRSVGLSLATTLITLVFGLPTAWFIATRPASQRGFWLFLITIPFWTNLLVRTIAVQEMIRSEGVLNRLLMALGIIHEPLQMMFTNFAVLLGMAYVFLPLMVLPVYAAIEKFDFRLAEAGYDLYASRLYCLRRVILPLVRPGIIAGSILVFVPSLGAYVTPRIMGGGKSMMLGNLIEMQFGQGRNWPLGAALSITLTILVLVALIWYTRITSTRKERNHG
ncbi:spermidine/putrescine transport system permease protein [Rhizobium sp. SG_E_25_P2]|uniref:ABC transporter permease n=1 Tax=Rhizobium sp. SG_E_25_P2 TaxID=2879942 RepID=UPI002475EE1B|nr:ABC transporter permease [Rhizobium sp. SG_E_25_P2]MDH6265896.1 spermidine/putrescine transport system permease protein [Rhizobium sp. SG_E_25_P2]